MIDETHDPGLTSWVEPANEPGIDFPIQNLPLGIFRTRENPTPRAGIAIGDFVLDASEWIPGTTLDGYMALPQSDRRDIRHRISRALEKGAVTRGLLSQTDCEMLLPGTIGDYTDFYASIHHARAVGSIFRPENPLLPNYKHVPIGYHGRASSVVVSGTGVRRPSGQLGAGIFGPTQQLDYELELGAWVGPGNALGEPIPISHADRHIVGVCLLNDWSARDIQRWEYQPLGPFLGKNFCTSASPWLVTWEALAPFRTTPAEHETPVLPYLQSAGADALTITLEVFIRTQDLGEPVQVSSASFRDMYWTIPQMIAHHTSNGCPLRPCDLLGSGTVSGSDGNAGGCLLELTRNGSKVLQLTASVRRCYLEDGDEVILRGYCNASGFRRIGFGVCSGRILTACMESLAGRRDAF
ncbi:MAG TPA: fumarylacetoacetase [Bryobacteraceae bacterium]|nr:fumarylacetoacetase [Bryobacteraceae bacterium]